VPSARAASGATNGQRWYSGVVPIPEKTVAEVVADISKRMKDPKYPQIAIGSFAEAHPDAGRYITAHSAEIGGGEGVMHAVFHAHVLDECFSKHAGRDLLPVRFRQLDSVANDDPVSMLRAREPAIADYIDSNVDEVPLRRVLCLIGLAMAKGART
jgi:hypothetical protein